MKPYAKIKRSNIFVNQNGARSEVDAKTKVKSHSKNFVYFLSFDRWANYASHLRFVQCWHGNDQDHPTLAAGVYAPKSRAHETHPKRIGRSGGARSDAQHRGYALSAHHRDHHPWSATNHKHCTACNHTFTHQVSTTFLLYIFLLL